MSLSLADIMLAAGGNTTAAQVLERNTRKVSEKFFTGVVTFLSTFPGISKGTDSFGKKGTLNEQTVAKFVVPQDAVLKNDDLKKVIAWKQASESVICPTLNMDVKIVRVNHVRDEDDVQTEEYEILVGAIMQNKNMTTNEAPKKDSKKNAASE